MSRRNIKPEVLWCANHRNIRGNGRNGWSFPREVDSKIQEICTGQTVVHFFGGLAKFGMRLDIDPIVKPDIIGDAWLPPFAGASFDVVVLDPPYLSFCREVLFSLLHGAAFVARKRVVWLGHIWAPSGFGCQLEQSWLVRCGDSLVVRALQVFRRTDKPMTPIKYFSRGPQMKYNRWLQQPEQLPFGD